MFCEAPNFYPLNRTFQAREILTLKCYSRQLMHWDTFKQGNNSTVGGDGECRVGKVRAGTTSPMPDHNRFKLQ